MDTESRTDEQVVAEALRQWPLISAGDVDAGFASYLVGALRSAGRMVGGKVVQRFTDEQLEAAVNAAWETQEFHRGPGGQVVEAPGPIFRHIISSALAAATAAAPQAQAAFEQTMAVLTAAETAYERGRLDERHDCALVTAYESSGERDPEGLRRSLRTRNPYTRKDSE